METAPATGEGLAYRVTLSEIADDLVRVGRSAVSNWKNSDRGHAFPQEIGEGRRPLYDLEEVLHWLRSPDSPVAQFREPSPRWWWAKAVETFHADFGGGTTRSYLIALIALRTALARGVERLAPAPARWEAIARAETPGVQLRQQAERLEERSESFRGLLVSPISALNPPPAVIVEIVQRLDAAVPRDDSWAADEVMLRTGGDGRRTEQFDTPVRLAELMCRLGEIGDGITILDPATGEGSMLIVAYREALQRHAAVVLRGRELDPQAWGIARGRLLIEGATADIGQPGDSILDDYWRDLRADLVLVDPPVAPDAPPLGAWIDYAVRHLDRHGHAVVALPAFAIAEGTSDRRRVDRPLQHRLASLAGQGHVEAVVTTPRRVRSDVLGPMMVCVLRATPAPDLPVLVVTHADDRLRVRSSSPVEVPIATVEVIEAVAAWRRSAPELSDTARSAIFARVVQGERLLPELEIAAATAGVPRTSGDPVPSSADRRTATDADRERRAELKARVQDLIRAVESQQETLWANDRDTFMRVREQINAIRRLL